MEPSSLRIAIFVQARMGSQRLPGKVLLPILGRPVLSYLMERLQKVKSKAFLVVLTTQLPKDDPIRAFCRENDLSCFSGSEEDVLDRFYKAAQIFLPDAVCRITADCPLVDPEIIDKVLSYYSAHSNVDYISNTFKGPYPHGMDVEIFSRKALEKAYMECHDPKEREHVTYGMYHHPELFSLGCVQTFEDNEKKLRLTLDTKEDFELIRHVFEALYPENPHFSLSDIAHYLWEHPEVAALNSHVRQKI